MTMKNKIDDLIVRYYCGTLDEKGAEILSAWVSSDAENAREFKSRLRVLQSSGLSTPDATTFLGKIKKKHFSRRRLARTLAISCAALGIAAVAVLLFGLNDTQALQSKPVSTMQLPIVKNVIQNSVPEQRKIASEPIIETPAASKKFIAPKDKIMPLTLEDGTSIILNKGTKLAVDSRFGQQTRTVTLDGEAFFDVAKDESKPFCIVCGDETYIVHGTSFNIQSYVRDGYSMVTLHTGSLEARVKDSTIMLDPGDELFVDDSDDNFTKRKVNTAYSSMWINDGTLHFSGLALKYVAAQLSHKYGVNVGVHSSVANIVYEGEIDKEPLETALKLISISAPTRLKITNLDGEYYITKL